MFPEIEAARAIRKELRSFEDLSTVKSKVVARTVRKALEETHETSFKKYKQQFRTLVQTSRDHLQANRIRKAEAQAGCDPNPKPEPKDDHCASPLQLIMMSHLAESCSSPSLADRFTAHLATVTNPSIRLLREPTVVQWLTGDLRFIDAMIVPATPVAGRRRTQKSIHNELKETEDKWGRATLRTRRPDLPLHQQWTNKFGEHICEELYTLLGSTVTKPRNRNHYQPDGEIDTAILEAKAQTFYTDGTAGEKILGVPFKYAEVPRLYGKPLRILCMGGAEQVCRESYGNLSGARTSAEKQKFLDFFKGEGITFVAATSLLETIVASL